MLVSNVVLFSPGILGKWSNLLSMFFWDGFCEKPPTRNNVDWMCFLVFLAEAGGWNRWNTHRCVRFGSFGLTRSVWLRVRVGPMGSRCYKLIWVKVVWFDHEIILGMKVSSEKMDPALIRFRDPWSIYGCKSSRSKISTSNLSNPKYDPGISWGRIAQF